MFLVTRLFPANTILLPLYILHHAPSSPRLLTGVNLLMDILISSCTLIDRRLVDKRGDGLQADCRHKLQLDHLRARNQWQRGPSSTRMTSAARTASGPTKTVPGPAMGIPPSSDSEADEEPQPAAARRRKRPLADLVRENHELYNTFMKKKMPKLLRQLGITSDTDLMFCK